MIISAPPLCHALALLAALLMHGVWGDWTVTANSACGMLHHVLQYTSRLSLLPLTGVLLGADAQSCTSITNKIACTSPGVGQTCCWDVGRDACIARPAALPQSPDNTCAGALGFNYL
jgi:hypothetical protein